MLNLEPIKARLAAATPGPWAASSPWGELRVVSAPNGPVSTANDAGGFNNADFIAAAPEDMAALVAEVERLTRANEQYRRAAFNLYSVQGLGPDKVAEASWQLWRLAGVPESIGGG
jgi:hypothetical protein